MGKRRSARGQWVVERKVDGAKRHDRADDPGGYPVDDFVFFHFSMREF
jgi:hypothetical protein